MKEKTADEVLDLKKSEHIDPVCGMRVDEKSASGSSRYEGEKFYFCSPQCKKDFEADPERYAVSVVPKPSGQQ